MSTPSHGASEKSLGKIGGADTPRLFAKHTPERKGGEGRPCSDINDPARLPNTPPIRGR